MTCAAVWAPVAVRVGFWCLALSACVLLGVLGADNVNDGGKGHGFGEGYDWRPLNEGLNLAKSQNKPVMLVIHKSWCGACKSLGTVLYCECIVSVLLCVVFLFLVVL